jgi:hypothetical protein
MTEKDYKAFLKAYSDYPSQDNEGYVPDREGFKCGFFAGIKYKEAELKELQEQWALQWNNEAAANAAGYNEAFEEFNSEKARLREALNKAEELSTHPFLYSEAALRDESLMARWKNFWNALSEIEENK